MTRMTMRICTRLVSLCHFGYQVTERPSLLAYYNTIDELDTRTTMLQQLAKG